MKFPVFNKVAVLRDALGPLLAELNIAPKIIYTDGPCVSFQSKTGRMISPVSLGLGGQTYKTENTLFDGDSLLIVQYNERKVSANGWTYYESAAYDVERLTLDTAATLERIAKEVRRNGVVPVGPDHAKVLNDPKMARLCLDLMRYGGDELELTCSRRDGIERVSCVDALGGKWVLAFEEQDTYAGANPKIVVNFRGEVFKTFDSEDTFTAARLVAYGFAHAREEWRQSSGLSR